MSYLINFKGILPSQGKMDKRKNYDSLTLKIIYKYEYFKNILIKNYLIGYPIYLKHTLYYDDEDMKKIRSLEYSHRFFVFDKIRESSNKEFNKGNYKEAT
jgi:hypothetical protein